MDRISALAGRGPMEGIIGETVTGAAGELGPSRRPRNLPEAAQQFESLLIGELLRMAHSGEGGWLGSGEGSTASPAIGLAEDSLAQAISSHGGLGLSNYVVQSLSK
jgi:Rod binding domain-containing protein